MTSTDNPFIGRKTPPVPTYPAMLEPTEIERWILCPSYCGWQHRLNIRLPRTARLDDAWNQLRIHVMECATGHAIMSLLIRLAQWCLDNTGEDPSRAFHNGKTELYGRPPEEWSTEIVRRAYLGMSAVDGGRHRDEVAERIRRANAEAKTPTNDELFRRLVDPRGTMRVHRTPVVVMPEMTVRRGGVRYPQVVAEQAEDAKRAARKAAKSQPRKRPKKGVAKKVAPVKGAKK